MNRPAGCALQLLGVFLVLLGAGATATPDAGPLASAVLFGIGFMLFMAGRGTGSQATRQSVEDVLEDKEKLANEPSPEPEASAGEKEKAPSDRAAELAELYKPGKEEETVRTGYTIRVCPHCAMEIKVTAVKCKHCGADL